MHVTGLPAFLLCDRAGSPRAGALPACLPGDSLPGAAFTAVMLTLFHSSGCGLLGNSERRLKTGPVQDPAQGQRPRALGGQRRVLGNHCPQSCQPRAVRLSATEDLEPCVCLDRSRQARSCDQQGPGCATVLRLPSAPQADWAWGHRDTEGHVHVSGGVGGPAAMPSVLPCSRCVSRGRHRSEVCWVLDARALMNTRFQWKTKYPVSSSPVPFWASSRHSGRIARPDRGAVRSFEGLLCTVEALVLLDGLLRRALRDLVPLPVCG